MITFDCLAWLLLTIKKTMKTKKISLKQAGKLGLLIALFSLFNLSCKKRIDGDVSGREYIYIESNNSNDNQNTILAYYNTGNGILKQVPGSPFPAGGSGVGNPQQVLGPDDSDSQIIISEDKKFLLAVNPGSNTIAVFRTNPNGSLQAVPGSPFPSGGQTPVSLNMSGQYVFVVNKSDDKIHPINQPPNYTTLTIDSKGVLSPVAGAKIEISLASSPSQALVSKDKKFLFGADFLAFQLDAPMGTLRSFTINGNGTLSPVAGTPITIPGLGGALGLWQHPNANVLYVGFPLQSKFGIYTIESSGALSFQSMVDAGPAVCWLRTTKDGNNLYTLNSGENSVSVYNSSNATAVSFVQKITLKNSGPVYMAMGMPFPTSQDFSVGLSYDDHYLYIVSQHTNTDFSIGNFNYLHVLNRSSDGRIAEPEEPIQIPVPNTFRPQGVAVYKPL